MPNVGVPNTGAPIDRVPLPPIAPVRTPPAAPGAMPIVASSDPALLPPQPIDHVEWAPEPRRERDDRPADVGWFLKLDDGRTIELERLVLMGRNPQPAPHEGSALLVQVGLDGQAVSKTHLAVATDEHGPYLVDRGSTNGTALVSSSGRLEPLMPGIRSRVAAGQRVSLGQRWFTVERH